jgi:hypothetical protein
VNCFTFLAAKPKAMCQRHRRRLEIDRKRELLHVFSCETEGDVRFGI